MKSKKFYYVFGGFLCLLAAVFFVVALTHPELSLPWANWVNYTIYALYGIYTVLIFCMPKFKGAGIAACGILAVEFIALAFIVLSIGIHFETHQTNWYLPIGLGLTCVANFTNLAIQKKKRGNKSC